MQRLHIGKEAGYLAIEQNAIATEEFTRPGHGLAHSDRAESLGQRRVMVLQLAFVLHLGESCHHSLRRRDVPEHLSQQILHRLK